MTAPNISSIKARRGTWARLAEARPPLPREFTQAEKRQRRQNGLGVILDGQFVLHVDIAAALNPLAERIIAAKHSGRFLRTEIDDNAGHLVGPRPVSASIDAVAFAAHDVVHVTVGVLREADVQRQTAHLPVDQRARARVVASTLAARPPMPEFSRSDAHSGAWATALVDMCEPYSTKLADLLGRTQTRTVSDRLLAALREFDAAAAALHRRLDRDAVMRADRAARPAPAPTEADRARAELESLGVQL
ncbi:hypothetical protein BH11ACT6_BH11ACT6_05130 [soil metagenome]